MMQKDYIKFAAIFASKLGYKTLDSVADYQDTIRGVMKDVACIFAQDNPKFDRDKFYRACEPKING